MKRAVLSLFVVVALFGCKPKAGDAASDAGPAATPSAAASADTAPSASVAAATDTPPAAVAMAPAANVPGVVVDPNARPSTDGDDVTAKAEINKANYKKEIDRLEHEDLAQDKK